MAMLLRVLFLLNDVTLFDSASVNLKVENTEKNAAPSGERKSRIFLDEEKETDMVKDIVNERVNDIGQDGSTTMNSSDSSGATKEDRSYALCYSDSDIGVRHGHVSKFRLGNI